MSVALRTTSGQQRFRIGETIPVTLEFSTTVLNKYRLNSATYDGGGRLPIDQFVLDGDGAVDPLADYFSGVMGFGMGGSYGTPPLGEEPYRVPLRLNDWFRFDRPGLYRLYVKSRRLMREGLSPGPFGQDAEMAVSNVMEIEIAPADAVWEAAKLAELRAMFPAPAEALKPDPWNPGFPDEKVMNALRELGHLGTPNAIRLLLSQSLRDANHLVATDLIRSPHRTLVVEELDRYLSAPGTIFPWWTLWLRARLDQAALHPSRPGLEHIVSAAKVETEKTRAEAQERQREFKSLQSAYAVKLIAMLARKAPAARMECVKMLMTAAPEEAKAAGLNAPEDFGLTREQLIEAFLDFPRDRQAELLTGKWWLVRSPQMIPVLKQVIETAPPQRALAIWDFNSRREPRNVYEEALDRLHEIAPGEARQVLVRDLVRPDPRFHQMANTILAAQDVPEVDVVFANQLASNGILPLAAKFATRELLQRFTDLYVSQSWECSQEEWLLAYFLRVDPEHGRELLANAMAARTGRKCYQSILSQVAAIVWNPTVEAQARATLDDLDGYAAGNAALTLAAHAGPEVEDLLWRHLEQWSEQWRGREEELRYRWFQQDDPRGGDRSRGEVLFNALSGAKSWIVDGERAQRLLAMCVDEQCRQRWTEFGIGPVRIWAYAGNPLYRRTFHIGGYQAESFDKAKARIAQYPAGTRFQWCPGLQDGFPSGEIEEMRAELARITREGTTSMEICP